MAETKHRMLRDKGFGFFGAITASLSHEINNVFAIINELSGLLEDLLEAASRGGALDVAKLKSTADRIAGQVQRGQTYVKRLNRFAHTVDEGHTSVDANETIDAVVTLCRRFAVLRRVQLEAFPLEISVAVAGGAFELQHVLFRCIVLALQACQQGESIQIHAAVEDGTVRFSFTNSSPIGSEAPFSVELEFLALLLGELGGALEHEVHAGCPLRLNVTLPRPKQNEKA